MYYRYFNIEKFQHPLQMNLKVTGMCLWALGNLDVRQFTKYSLLFLSFCNVIVLLKMPLLVKHV